jgi:hypothetical protein
MTPLGVVECIDGDVLGVNVDVANEVILLGMWSGDTCAQHAQPDFYSVMRLDQARTVMKLLELALLRFEASTTDDLTATMKRISAVGTELAALCTEDGAV